jgi:hypothetical protein
MKPNKLNRHLESVHAECVGKTPEFFHRKPNEFNKQKQAFAEITAVTSEHCLHHQKLPTELPASAVGSLVLPAVVDMGETVLDESCGKDLRKITLTDNTIGRKTFDT